MSMQPNKMEAVGFEERVSLVSGANKNGEYEEAKTPGELEGGALRAGGAPVYTSPEILAVLAQYVCVGLVYGSMPSMLYPIFNPYFHLTGAQYNSAKALVTVGWSLKAFIGMLSDCVPIMGYRRKSWMIIGWTLCTICLLVLATMDFGPAYYSDLKVQDIAPVNRSIAENATVSPDARNKGGIVAIIFGLACIGYVIADVPADALVVEYAQREPLATRGRMQSLIYSTRFVNQAIASGIVGFCMNSARFGGDFDWDFGLHTMFWVLCVPTIAIIPITAFFVVDHKVPRVPFGAYLSQMWGLIKKRAMWQIMCFNFSFNLLGQISPTASTYVMSRWAGVTNLNYQIVSLLSSLILAAVVAAIGKWGTHWNWRIVVVTTTLSTITVDIAVQYMTFYDVVRNQWFYLGVPLVEMLPQGILFIVTTFVIVELAEIGNEGMVYGLLTTVSNLPGSVGPVLANLLNANFDVTEEDIATDTPHVRNQVAYTYMIYYACIVFSCCCIVFLPSQKEGLHELKRNGGVYPVIGGCVIGFIFCMLCYSLTAMMLSMFETTRCLLIAGGRGCGP